MPIYLFQCSSCLSTFEIQLKISDTLRVCPLCQSRTAEFEKLPTRFGTAALGGKKDAPSKPVPSSSALGKSEHCHGHGKHGHHDPHASCKKGYIDKLVKRYDKSIN
ncbi:MAG: hypothetical protein HRU09_07745 [Oligoflexales bacterium]|nr:hypothetical protein [Oligoflexales bacterium]